MKRWNCVRVLRKHENRRRQCLGGEGDAGKIARDRRGRGHGQREELQEIHGYRKIG